MAGFLASNRLSLPSPHLGMCNDAVPLPGPSCWSCAQQSLKCVAVPLPQQRVLRARSRAVVPQWWVLRELPRPRRWGWVDSSALGCAECCRAEFAELCGVEDCGLRDNGSSWRQFRSLVALSGGGFRTAGWKKWSAGGRLGLRKENAAGEGRVAGPQCSKGQQASVQQEWREIVSAEPHFQFSDLPQDLGAMGLVLVGAVVWVKVFGFLGQRKIVERKLSRKLVHISSGLLYLACWPLFSLSPGARYTAALVPLVNIVRFLIAALGIQANESLVASMSREGDPKELLRGPFYYLIVLTVSTLLFWRDSPIGVISLAMMCGGDGVADIVGRRYGGLKLPYNEDKSWAGSLAMCSFGFLVSVGFLWYFSAWGFFQLDVVEALPKVAAIALAATIVESLPLTTKYDDNVTVPLTTILLGLLLFPIKVVGS